MEDLDIRWKQRFSNFSNSVDNLESAVSVVEPNALERQGLIKAFELAYELAWKTLQDYLRYTGVQDVVGPKPVIRRAFIDGILTNGNAWHDMHQARNESAHLYDESRAKEIEAAVRNVFVDLLRELRNTLGARHDSE